MNYKRFPKRLLSIIELAIESAKKGLPKYLLLLFILYSIAVPYHEYIHLFFLKALGGDGYIVFFFDFSSLSSIVLSFLFPRGLCAFTEMPNAPYADLLINMMGGLGCGIMYLILAFAIGRMGKERTIEGYAALLSNSLIQLFYATIETLQAAGILTRRQFLDLTSLAIMAGFITGIYISKYHKHLKKLATQQTHQPALLNKEAQKA